MPDRIEGFRKIEENTQCLFVSDISVRASELQEQCQSLTEREIQSFMFCFTKSEFDEFLEDDILIGEIKNLRARILVVEQKHEEEKEQLMKHIAEQQRLMDEVLSGYKSESVLVQMIRTNVAQKKNKEIRGLTILDKELFVVNEKSSEVEIYDSIKFNFSRRWNLKELFDPKDIVSCDKNKCLYIFDYRSRGQSKIILRVDANGKLISNWTIGDFDGPPWEGSLSVTDESNVILTLHCDSKLIEYSSDGQLIREIELSADADIYHPWHALKLTTGHFLVSHGNATDDLNRVCIVDKDGKLKKSFGGKPGSIIGQMKSPVHMSVDGKGFVMVVDKLNSRVLLLDSDLKFKKEILSEKKHGFKQHPTKIHLDKSNGRLFVFENVGLFNTEGHIMIFDLK